jgi:glutaredoxin
MLRIAVIAVVLLVLGGWLMRGQPKPMVEDRPQVEIYLASYCPESRRAKAYLEERAIEFAEYDVEKDMDRRKEFYARGGKGIPLLFVKGQAMHGFDAREFERLLNAR